MVKQKVLKVELCALFFLSLINIVFVYLGDSFPDNYLEISSATKNVSYIGFYLASIVALMCFYTGTWTIFVFALSTVFYTLIFNKRSKWYDLISFVWFSAFAVILSYLFMPEFLGDGLFLLLAHHLSALGLYSTLVMSILAIMMLSLNSSYSSLTDGWSRISSALLSVGSDVKVMCKKKPLLSLPQANPVVDKSKELLSIGSYTQDKQKRIKGVSVNSPRESKVDVEPWMAKLKPTTSSQSEINFDSHELIQCVANDQRNLNPPAPGDKYFKRIIQCIEEKMQELKIASKVIHVQKGPVVDTYELDLGAGVRVSQVRNIADDLSLALYGAPVRITYPMAGKASMGVEVPRDPRETIFLDEVLNSTAFMKAKHRLPLAMGRNAYGETVVVDLASAPHMLVAGETGSGKSVFINTLLVSLLVKLSPTQLRMILIDPKTVELAPYSNLPHLALPIANEANMACVYLMWAVQEMDKRYKMLRALAVRNIDGFNRKVLTATEEEMSSVYKYLADEEQRYENHQMPYIVVVVDEFADLMTNKKYGKDIEMMICRLAQKARACGIHLVLATQRPSVDVITGVIKSNFPTRVSFRVATSIDSKTILSHAGAEKLLGQGDMLYKQGIETVRLHSAFVHEEEVEALVSKLSQIEFSYDKAAMNFVEQKEAQDSSGGELFESSSLGDDMYDQAVRIAVDNRSVSASMLQRRLHIGYNRAANLVEEMEKNGVVGPQRGSKPREVLISES